MLTGALLNIAFEDFLLFIRPLQQVSPLLGPLSPFPSDCCRHLEVWKAVLASFFFFFPFPSAVDIFLYGLVSPCE